MKWRNNCTKIILKASLEQLIKLKDTAGARYMVDDFKNKQSLTAVGFPPKISDAFKDYKLY